jgi:hypothetical protein
MADDNYCASPKEIPQKKRRTGSEQGEDDGAAAAADSSPEEETIVNGETSCHMQWIKVRQKNIQDRVAMYATLCNSNGRECDVENPAM